MRKGNYDAEFQHTATRRWLRTFRHWFIFNVRFQHTATRRWLQVKDDGIFVGKAFQHTATRRWLLPFQPMHGRQYSQFQHTATRRWLHQSKVTTARKRLVSTHSHPKVAASERTKEFHSPDRFQHTATRRWLHSRRVSREPHA